MSKIDNSLEEEKEIMILYWQNKMSELESYLFSEYKKNNAKFKKKVKEKRDFNIFEFAPKEILKNEDLMLKALDEQFISYQKLDKSLKESREFSLRYLKENKYSYYFNIKEEFLHDEDIMDICIKKDARAYTSIYYKSSLIDKYGNKEKALSFLDLNPKVYEFFGEKTACDLDVAQKAIRLDITNAKFMNKRLSSKIFKDKDLATQLLENNLDFFVKINNKFRDDEEFLIPLIEKRPSLIEFVSKRLMAKKDFVNKAISAYNLMDFISSEFKADAEMMQRHLLNCPYSRWEVSRLQDIKPLLINIIQSHYYVYERLTEEEKIDEDYIFAVLNNENFYEKTENFFNPYQKVSILKILPEFLRKKLISECISTYPDINFGDQLEVEVLSFARKKYTNIYLNKTLVKNELVSESIEYKKKRMKV